MQYGIEVDPQTKRITLAVDHGEAQGTVRGMPASMAMNIAVMLARAAHGQRVAFPTDPFDAEVARKLAEKLGGAQPEEMPIPDVDGALARLEDARALIVQATNKIDETFEDLLGDM